jgi:predicted signal transduction protein with EAL and GGDEF domain
MVQAARRFEQIAASSIGILARWGGAQFALLARGIETTDAAMGLAASLHEALHEPFELRRHRLAITARVGMTCVAAGPQRADDVVREADIALSVAKRTENSLSVAYTPSMGGDAASLVSLEADLHVALERRELTLLFQPIVDLRGPRAVGAEALLRWRHPVEGLLRPDRFLPIAEEAGLMVPITRWAVRRVCRLAGEWRRRLPPDAPFYLSVNLSAGVLRDLELADFVGAQLEETSTPPEALKFELTEGGLISNVGVARDALERLRRTGVQLMLDDFGTGYSSLNHLQLFPFDYVKIDRPITGGAGERGASLASAMVQLAASLGLTPIAEVVESQSTADALEEMGCHFGQGNFFCAPVEPEEALACLRGATPAQAGVAAGSGAEAEQAREWVDDSPTLMLPANFLSEDNAEAS